MIIDLSDHQWDFVKDCNGIRQKKRDLSGESDAGADAVDKARQFKPDIVLIDLVMPGLDGFEAVKQIRQIPEMATQPIFSASAYETDQEKSRQAGCDAFLAKPVDEQTLLNLLENHLPVDWIYQVRQKEIKGPEMEGRILVPLRRKF